MRGNIYEKGHKLLVAVLPALSGFFWLLLAFSPLSCDSFVICCSCFLFRIKMISKNSTFDTVKSDTHFDRLKVPFIFWYSYRDTKMEETLVMLIHLAAHQAIWNVSSFIFVLFWRGSCFILRVSIISYLCENGLWLSWPSLGVLHQRFWFLLRVKIYHTVINLTASYSLLPQSHYFAFFILCSFSFILYFTSFCLFHSLVH